MHLLVLDDEVKIAEFIAHVASRGGWSAVPTSTESDFQARLKEKTPDAVVLDLQLGSSDGVQQLRYLHDQGYTGAVVLMSGFDLRVLESARSLGTSLGLRMAAALRKPVRLSTVRTILEELSTAPVSTDPGRAAAGPVSEAQPISPGAIDHAINAGELILHLQPIVTAQPHTVVRLEALVRWLHPARGMVPPLEFIPVAEQDQALTDKLTSWVIRRALGHHSELRREGLRIPIAVNISGLNLQSLEFPDRVYGLLTEQSLPSSALTLEITESVAMHDIAQTTEILSRLRLKGIDLAIDDLGTGYSSLGALRQMPFSEMKIDGSFIRDMATSPDTVAVVKSLIDLAHKLGITSVAEGVEDQPTTQRLIDLGIDYLQGYHFSRPLAMERLLPWLRTQPIAPSA